MTRIGGTQQVMDGSEVGNLKPASALKMALVYKNWDACSVICIYHSLH